MAVTIYADRSKIPGKVKLNNINILRLLNPTTDVEIPIMAKHDGQAAVLLQNVLFKPAIAPPVPPVQSGDILYDSNIDIDWAAIAAGLKPGKDHLIISDTYGNFVPNGKYFRMKASGSPRMLLYPATKELCLEHNGKYGRGYFGVCNYSSILSGEFKLTDPRHKFSVKTRNRHQYRDIDPQAENEERQGGQGTGIGIGDIDSDLEIYHEGGEESGPQQKLDPKLEINKYYPFKHSVFDDNGKVHVTFELNRGDGFKIVNEGTTNAPKQFFNKEQFEAWSEFWLRLNTPEELNQRIWLKNIMMVKL